MKKFLFILRRLPHCGSHVQECLDLILTAAAFDQPVSLLFVDDGVYQLKTRQQPESQGLKDIAAIFSALELYDVQDLFVETESLQSRNLQVDDLQLPVKCLPRQALSEFIGGFDVLIPD